MVSSPFIRTNVITRLSDCEAAELQSKYNLHKAFLSRRVESCVKFSRLFDFQRLR